MVSLFGPVQVTSAIAFEHLAAAIGIYAPIGVALRPNHFELSVTNVSALITKRHKPLKKLIVSR